MPAIHLYARGRVSFGAGVDPFNFRRAVFRPRIGFFRRYHVIPSSADEDKTLNERPQKVGQSRTYDSPHRNAAQACSLSVPRSDAERYSFDAKDFEELFCYYSELRRWCSRSLDSLSVSRSGKSSGELSSVMIRNPKVGNSLEQGVCLNRTSQI